MKKKVLRALAALVAVLLLGGGYVGYRLIWGRPFTLNQLADRQALFFLMRNPELFSMVGFVDGTIADRHSGRLAEVGVAKRDADYALLDRAVAEVRELDRARLDPQDRITYDVLLAFYEQRLAFRAFPWVTSEGSLYPIDPMWGTQTTLPTFLQKIHVVKNEKTARNYVARLEAAGDKLDAVTGEMLRQSAAGVRLPPSLLEKSIAVIDDTVAAAPEDNALVTTFAERMAKVASLDEATRTSLRDAAVVAVRTRIYPAYARMRAALVAERPGSAGVAAGVGRLPDGAAYYRAALKAATTTDYTAEQIHDLGLRKVARIDAEMDRLLASQGLPKGTVAERIQALNVDPRFAFPDSDQGRTEVLTRFREILDEVKARMPEYFSAIPREALVVERVPASAEKGAAGGSYTPAAMDGSRPGTFNLNLRDVRALPRFGMKTLAYHEGIPGHHWQIATLHELRGLPIIRKQPVFTAFTEGWALYAERLAAEMGLYENDPFGDLGRLRDELFRAVRLVVDTGIHAKGWSREQAIAYMIGTTGMAEGEVVTEVERYMGQPGQACAYKIGQLKILELRERARTALGAKFSLKDFHRVVLENGALPLTVLEPLVDEWIAKGGG